VIEFTIISAIKCNSLMALKINGMVKMTYRIIALFFMLVFYGIYFTKMMIDL